MLEFVFVKATHIECIQTKSKLIQVFWMYMSSCLEYIRARLGRNKTFTMKLYNLEIYRSLLNLVKHSYDQ